MTGEALSVWVAVALGGTHRTWGASPPDRLASSRTAMDGNSEKGLTQR